MSVFNRLWAKQSPPVDMENASVADIPLSMPKRIAQFFMGVIDDASSGGIPFLKKRCDDDMPAVFNLHTMKSSGRCNGFASDRPIRKTGSESAVGVKLTLKELQTQNPALANEIMAAARAAVSEDAAKAERRRMKELEALPATCNADLVHEAKYGDTPCSAQELTCRAAKEMAKQGKKFMSDMEEDTKVSGAQKVGALPGPEDTKSVSDNNMIHEQKLAYARSAVQTLFNPKIGSRE